MNTNTTSKRMPAADGLDVIIHTIHHEEVRGWVHPCKGTETALAIMIGRRKTPRMIPVADIAHWVWAY